MSGKLNWEKAKRQEPGFIDHAPKSKNCKCCGQVICGTQPYCEDCYKSGKYKERLWVIHLKEQLAKKHKRWLKWKRIISSHVRDKNKLPEAIKKAKAYANRRKYKPKTLNFVDSFGNPYDRPKALKKRTRF